MIISLFAGCNEEDRLTYDILGEWEVVYFVDYNSATIITKNEENTGNRWTDGDNTIKFTALTDTSGIVSGKTITNVFSGDYKIDKQGSIIISDVFETCVCEPEWGCLLTGNLKKADRYAIKNGFLTIFCDEESFRINLVSAD